MNLSKGIVVSVSAVLSLILLLVFVAAQSQLGLAGGMTVLGCIAAAIAGLVLYFYLSYLRGLALTRDQIDMRATQDFRQTQALIGIYATAGFRHPLPLMRGYAISPDFGSSLYALVLQLRPRTILELGSGVSTLISGYALEKLGGGRVISLDHDARWAGSTRAEILAHGLQNTAEVRIAPLDTNNWYDPATFADLQAIDLLVVDGPPATLGRMARYPALPMLSARLSPNATILIDDALRPDEQEMIQRWLNEFPGFVREDLLLEKGAVLLRRNA